ncbi:MAG TPA: sigma-70 family RNA polymerase sigma factor [Thermoanaerobaculia bacterium]|nr:sigma-70 family RNA polymerase sigma factor [Thermoanaerobaculia bacterium]
MPAEDEDVRISDLALVRRTAAGDAVAFSRLARRHQAAVYRFASALVPEGPEAEEVLQEAFLTARRTARRYQEEVPVRTWLLALARQVAHRRHPRRTAAPLDVPSLRELGRAAGWGRPDDNPFADRLFDRQRLAETLAALPPEDREILILRDLEGLSGEEAAAVAGLSVAVAKTRLLRARLRLIAKLKEDRDNGR